MINFGGSLSKWGRFLFVLAAPSRLARSIGSGAGRQPWETVAPALAGYSVRGTQRVAARRADERQRRAGLNASTIPAAQSLQLTS